MLSDAFLSEFALSSKCHRKLLFDTCGKVDIQLLNRKDFFSSHIRENLKSLQCREHSTSSLNIYKLYTRYCVCASEVAFEKHTVLWKQFVQHRLHVQENVTFF